MKYPIGIQSFEKIRKGGYVYVDKTDLVYKLADSHICLMSRPRLFGKSLLMDTLRCYFGGRKELFEGLKIMDLEQEWKQYPVVSFDFGSVNGLSENELGEYILRVIAKTEEKYDIVPRNTEYLEWRFTGLLEALHEKTGESVVVLFDNYDKPLLDLVDFDNLAKKELFDRHRQMLFHLFTMFKPADMHLRFVMLTGTANFMRGGMLSGGFNQYEHVTIGRNYAKMLGFTEEELYTVFAEPIHELAFKTGCSEEVMKQQLKEKYGGYDFHEGKSNVYNPYSILSVLQNMQLRDYWVEAGTPTYIRELLAKSDTDIEGYTRSEKDELSITTYDETRPLLLSLLFQSGYLTIKEYDSRFGLYKLKYPNLEARKGINDLKAALSIGRATVRQTSASC